KRKSASTRSTQKGEESMRLPMVSRAAFNAGSNPPMSARSSRAAVPGTFAGMQRRILWIDPIPPRQCPQAAPVRMHLHAACCDGAIIVGSTYLEPRRMIRINTAGRDRAKRFALLSDHSPWMESMPEEAVLPERELRVRVIRRMEDGRLPVALPTRI